MRTPTVPRRVLVVEDEMLVSMLLEDMLGELGYHVVGPVTTIDEAIAVAEREPIDAAILDVNLNGRNTYSVAECLQRRGVPFLFATGYGETAISERFRAGPKLQKPFQRSELARALEKAMGATRRAAE